jgi:AraC-like DNA-binding protein
MVNITHSLLFNSYEKVGEWWNYKNIISPFNRLYFITEGEGRVFLDNILYHLSPGKLFLIPKFTFHTYQCDTFMGHYYLCFFDEIIFGESVFESFDFNFLVDAKPGDVHLFERINQLNPGGRIVNPDPASYDNDKSLYTFSKSRKQLQMPDIIEIQGIIYQLMSRFIQNNASRSPMASSKKRFSKLTNYIYQHLNSKITLHDLAGIACLSPDYLSKQFLEVMGVRPMEYVNRIRIERAQMLLFTTDLSIKQIADNVGFSSNSYFSTLFRKQTLCSPEEYRKMHNRM